MPQPTPARFEDGRTLHLAGLSNRYDFSRLAELKLLWQRFAPWLGRVPGQHGHDSYGVCHNPDGQGAFDYLAGVEVTGTATLPEGFTTLVLAPQHYAVFEHRGSLECIKTTFDAIFTQWLPASGKRQADAAVFERYPAGYDPTAPQALMEIWIPLERS